MPKVKRGEEDEKQSKSSKSSSSGKIKRDKNEEEMEDSESDIEFEDAFPDDYESEEEIEAENEDEDEDGDYNVIDDEEENEDDDQEVKVWRRGVDKLEEDEVLEADQSAYDMLHTLGVEWPFLTFAFLRDELGDNRTRFPHSMTMVAGTQANQIKENYLSVMRISRICKTKEVDSEDEDSDEDDEDDEDDDEDLQMDPIVEEQRIPFEGSVNRLKVAQIGHTKLVASWSDLGVVSIHDVQHYEAVTRLPYLGKPEASKEAPLFTMKNHKNEGYALDWSLKEDGRLLTGDCSGVIYESAKKQSGFEVVAPYKSHSASVEDLQWSPTESDVFASCSVDKTIKIWDSRANKRQAMITVKAHDADVNTISWSRKVTYLLASGSDDCSFKIWDLRSFKEKSTVAEFKFHSDAISCVEWNPHDETQLIVSSYDNQITIWDMSLELDDAEELNEDYPPQLFFIHQGQTEVKDVHWHPQVPHAVASSSTEGIMVWKSSNSTEVPDDSHKK